MVNFYELYYQAEPKIDETKKWLNMNSFQKECTDLKQKYDACYTVWFTDRFLKGDSNDEIDSYPTDTCRELKNEYEACFNTWFAEKFLKGEHNDNMCSVLLRSYTNCVQKAMKEHNISIKEMETDTFEVEKNVKPTTSSNK